MAGLSGSAITDRANPTGRPKNNPENASAQSAPAGRLSGLRSQAETWDEHGEIIEAIARRDVGRARALARHHVDRVKQVVVPFLVSSVPPTKQHPGSSSQHRRNSGVGTQRAPAGRAVTFDSSLLK